MYELHQLPEAVPDSWKCVMVLQNICHHFYNDDSLPVSNGQGTPLLSARKALHPACDRAVLICSLGSAGYWGTASGTGAMPNTGCSSAVPENIAPAFLGSHRPPLNRDS